MNSAYAVLGLKTGAGFKEVLESYHKLMQLLDLSHYAGTPLVDLARQRRQEVEQAYQQLIERWKASEQSPVPGSTILNKNISLVEKPNENQAGTWLFVDPEPHEPQQEDGWCSRTCDNCGGCGDCCDCLNGCGDCGDFCSCCD